MKPKRTTDLIEFATLLQNRLLCLRNSTGLKLRVFQITSPTIRGDVQTILATHTAGDPLRSMTYLADGSWTGLSFYSPDQI